MLLDEENLIVNGNGFQKKTQKTPAKELDRELKMRAEYEAENNNLKSLDKFINEEFGERGTSKRENFERGYEAFKLGVLIHEARA